MNPPLAPPAPGPRGTAAGFTFVSALASLAFLGALAAVAVPLVARRLGPRAPAAAATVIQRAGAEVTRDLEHIGTVAAAYAGQLAAKLPPPVEPSPAAVPDAWAGRGPPPAIFWEIPAPPPFFFPPEAPPIRFWSSPWVWPPPGRWERRRAFGPRGHPRR
jgi:hypothetical protein